MECGYPYPSSSKISSWIRWEKIQTRKHFFDVLGKKLGYTTKEDWYNITQDDIYKHKGSILLLHHYQGSPTKALQHIYPDHDWQLWKFKCTPKGYWDKLFNQREYLDWLEQQFGYKCKEDWYKVTQEDFFKHGGTTVLVGYYQGSPSKLLQSVYPEHNWMLWRFQVIPKGYWKKLLKDQSEQKKMVDWLGSQLSIKSLFDWHRISVGQIHKWIRLDNNVLLHLLKGAYPQHIWDVDKFDRSGKSVKSSQRELVQAMQELFPGHSANRGDCDLI